jgi:hypothetical protein
MLNTDGLAMLTVLGIADVETNPRVFHNVAKLGAPRKHGLDASNRRIQNEERARGRVHLRHLTH